MKGTRYAQRQRKLRNKENSILLASVLERGTFVRGSHGEILGVDSMWHETRGVLSLTG